MNLPHVYKRLVLVDQWLKHVQEHSLAVECRCADVMPFLGRPGLEQDVVHVHRGVGLWVLPFHRSPGNGGQIGRIVK